MKKQSILICIGARKAGTTWFHRCISEHNKINCSYEKEPHFFSQRYKQDKEHYLALFPKKSGIKFDASTTYISSPKAAQRISSWFPEAKIIAIIRDPADRSFSDYLHEKSRNRMVSKNITEAVNEYQKNVDGSLHGTNIERYLSHFPSKNICLIEYKHMNKFPQETLDEICNFVGIEKFKPKALNVRYHSTQARSNKIYFKVSKTYLKLRKNKFGRFIITILRKFGINNLLIDRILKRTAKKKPELTAEERQYLNDFFNHDKEKFHELIIENNIFCIGNFSSYSRKSA